MNTIKKYLPLLIFLLLTRSGFCQKIYPRLAVIDKDTVCIINMMQVDSINVMREELSQERAIHKSLLNSIHAYQLLTDAYDKRNIELVEASDSLLVVRRNDKQEMVNLNEQIKSQNKHVAWLKLSRGVCFVAAVVFAGIHYIP